MTNLTELNKAILAIRSVINNSIKMEVRGEWIWITGEVLPIKDTLIKAGYKYSKDKNAFYWHATSYRKRSKRLLPMSDIRELYNGGVL